MPHKVVLFNPPAVFWTMPLGLIAVGSALDRHRYRVVIVDGRLDGEGRLREELADALCLGMTVLTGRPLGHAIRILNRVREWDPELPVIWGGWHPSLFPAACLTEANATAAVIGQGERTFAEIVERLAEGRPLDGVAGCWNLGNDGRPRQNLPRAMEDVNRFPAHDYELIDVEAYFRAKGRRQLDYVTSQGCRFRCAFCADPAVFGRRWSGLEPERVLDEVDGLYRRHRMTDLAFQDETFFTSRRRVIDLAGGLLEAGRRLTWTATLRADQGRRMPDEDFRLCRESGLREVVLGVESGSAETLERIRKDITLDDVRVTVERLRRHDIGASIGVIVGFPGEPESSVLASLSLARELAAMGPLFTVSVFCYQPTPGSALADEVARSGSSMPSSLAEWADFDYVAGTSVFLDSRLGRIVDDFRFYNRYAFAPTRNPIRWGFHALARWRTAHHAYGFPVERRLIERLRPIREVS